MILLINGYVFFKRRDITGLFPALLINDYFKYLNLASLNQNKKNFGHAKCTTLFTRVLKSYRLKHIWTKNMCLFFWHVGIKESISLRDVL